MNCLNCNTSTSNPKFCSKSCAASHNNKLFPKRKKTAALPCCSECGKQLNNKRTIKCAACHKLSILADKTLGEVVYMHHHKSSAFALVRSRARAVIAKCPCQKCGYSKHTEVCHIKPIKDFDYGTMLSVINAPDNLIRLCPNCHWELDHNLQRSLL